MNPVFLQEMNEKYNELTSFELFRVIANSMDDRERYNQLISLPLWKDRYVNGLENDELFRMMRFDISTPQGRSKYSPQLIEAFEDRPKKLKTLRENKEFYQEFKKIWDNIPHVYSEGLNTRIILNSRTATKNWLIIDYTKGDLKILGNTLNKNDVIHFSISSYPLPKIIAVRGNELEQIDRKIDTDFVMENTKYESQLAKIPPKSFFNNTTVAKVLLTTTALLVYVIIIPQVIINNHDLTPEGMIVTSSVMISTIFSVWGSESRNEAIRHLNADPTFIDSYTAGNKTYPTDDLESVGILFTTDNGKLIRKLFMLDRKFQNTPKLTELEFWEHDSAEKSSKWDVLSSCVSCGKTAKFSCTGCPKDSAFCGEECHRVSGCLPALYSL